MAQPAWEGNRSRKYAEIWSCGRNDHGQCGTGTMEDKPRVVFQLAGVEQNPLVCEDERKVVEWCEFSSLLSPIQGGSCGSMHSIFLSQDIPPSHSADAVCKILN